MSIAKIITPIGEFDAERFYRLRDDRTNRLTSSRNYQSLRVRVVANKMTTQTYSGQVQLLTVCNELARWCRYVEYGFPDAVLVPLLQRTGYTRLHERIKAEVEGADPFGHFAFRGQRSEDIAYTLKVGGESAEASEQVSFSINSNGWVAQAGVGARAFTNPPSPDNPIGAVFSACIGVADAFKVATGVPESRRVRDLDWSLFDFSRGTQHLSPTEQVARRGPQMPSEFVLGNTHIIGVGSVGSAVVYLLAMLPVVGSIFLIDHDIVKIENLNRSPLFGVDNLGQAKIMCAMNYLNGVVEAEGFKDTYHEFISRCGRLDPDVILALANEFGVRSFIEHNFPPIQVYGTTTQTWGINYHRHIPFREDCSVCRFPEDASHLPMVCSEASIDTTEGEHIDAALPFLSMGAAILTVADLAKLQYPEYPFTPNFCYADFEGDMEHIVANQKYLKPACLCTTRSTKIHRSLIESSRFASLSLF